MSEHIADEVVVATLNGEAYYPHYYSTYCVHGLHDRCRLTCKHCERYCRCNCHRTLSVERDDFAGGAVA